MEIEEKETIKEKKLRLIEELKPFFYIEDIGWRGRDFIVFNPIIGTELWKDVPSDIRYRASNYGRVLDQDTSKYVGYTHLNSSRGNTLYWRYSSVYRGGSTCKRLHRIVAETWLPDYKFKPFVDHYNGIGLDNSITNIRMCTCGENRVNSKSYNSTGEQNIYYHSNRNKKYRVTFSSLLIGYYHTLEEAILVRNNYMLKHPNLFYESNRPEPIQKLDESSIIII